ncbi:hypothetical protein FRB99_007327 [Tulasnella sp. 403]|nr:hypothetical protein FRB99_007327 [Tulasnella sp. 403]
MTDDVKSTSRPESKTADPITSKNKATSKSTKPTSAAAPAASSLLAPRTIPGAPPPEPSKPSAPKKKKSKKKPKSPGEKGKTDTSVAGDEDVTPHDSDVHVTDARSAALIEQAPDQDDIENGRVAGDLVASQEEIQDEIEEVELTLEEWNIWQPPPNVISAKHAELEAKLSQDSLSEAEKAALETTVRVLKDVQASAEEAEVKRQAEQERLLRRHRLNVHGDHTRTLNDAVADTESKGVEKVNAILSFLALSNTLASTSPIRPFIAPIGEQERAAIASAWNALLGDDLALRAEVANGLIDENVSGVFEQVPFARLRALTKAFAHPISPMASPPAQTTNLVPDVYANGAGVQSISFTMDSELDTAPSAHVSGGADAAELANVHGVEAENLEAVAQDPNAELVEGDAIPSASTVQQEWVEIAREDTAPVHHVEDVYEGQTAVVQAEDVVNAPESATLDWAADDLSGELPPLDTLHAKFGTSGDATPTSAFAANSATVEHSPAPAEVAEEGSERPTLLIPTAPAKTVPLLEAGEWDEETSEGREERSGETVEGVASDLGEVVVSEGVREARSKTETASRVVVVMARVGGQQARAGSPQLQRVKTGGTGVVLQEGGAVGSGPEEMGEVEEVVSVVQRSQALLYNVEKLGTQIPHAYRPIVP